MMVEPIRDQRDADDEDASTDADDARIAVGIRGLMTDSFEGWLKANYTDGDAYEGELSATVGAQFKFNQTWGAQLLRSFDGNPAVDPDPQSLRLRLLHYLHSVYAKTPHESLDGQTPEERWNSDPRSLSFPQDQAWLDERFVTSFERSVSKDNVIPYEGTDYEVPRGHAGTQIRVDKNLLRGTLAVLHEGRLVAIHPVDLVANAYSRRARLVQPAALVETPIVQTAAQLAFQTEFAPLVDATGGYPKGDDEQ